MSEQLRLGLMENASAGQAGRGGGIGQAAEVRGGRGRRGWVWDNGITKLQVRLGTGTPAHASYHPFITWDSPCPFTNGVPSIDRPPKHPRTAKYAGRSREIKRHREIETHFEVLRWKRYKRAVTAAATSSVGPQCGQKGAPLVKRGKRTFSYCSYHANSLSISPSRWGNRQ